MKSTTGEPPYQRIAAELRRRIERATTALAPLQSKSRVGYTFRAPLVRA